LVERFSIQAAVINTALGFHIADIAHSCGIPALWIIRESEDPVQHFWARLSADMRSIFSSALQTADRLVFVSATTRDRWTGSAALDERKAIVIANGLSAERFRGSKQKSRSEIRKALGFEENDVVLLNVGTICERKNQAQLLDALLMLPADVLNRLRVVFVGQSSRDGYSLEFIHRIKTDPRLNGRVAYVRPRRHIGDYYLSADAFVLTSLLESYPRVVLEAMEFSLPIIANPVFGVREQTQEGVNALYYDENHTGSLADRLKEILDPELREKLRAGSARLAAQLPTYRQMVGSYIEVLSTLRPERFASLAVAAIDEALVETSKQVDVSVIVPNYNYARYLPERLATITEQTVSPREIIFLDDASTDDSVAVAEEILKQSSIPYRIVRNDRTEGPYPQWIRGLSLAVGDYVWIAEADDACDPRLLSRLTDALKDRRVSIAYCQSNLIDKHGDVVAPDMLPHYDFDELKWRKDYVELGLREVVDSHAFRNIIPNASACVFKRSAVRGIEPMLSNFRFCGDWLLYAHILADGKAAYIADSLNSFRRHGGSVTERSQRGIGYLRELAAIRAFICSHYPMHPRQLERMNLFLDRDFPIEGVEKNSACPAVADFLDQAATAVAGNRRIAFITTNNGSHSGGSELLWKAAAKRLRAIGHDVVVLIKAWQPRPDFFDEFEDLGIKIYFKEAAGLDGLLSFKPDLVVISMGDQDEGTDYFNILLDAKLPYVIVNQLTKEVRFWPVPHDRVAKVKFGYLSAVRNFFVSRNNHRVMEDRLECRIPNGELVYNPTDVVLSEEPPPFPSMSDGLRLALPAQLTFSHKGHDLLMEVLRDEKWKSRPVTVNLYGDGKNRQQIEDMARKYGMSNVILHGYVDDIRRVWRENHGIVMPSRMEGLPNALVGAMISARVPIVTDIGGHAEVIEDGVSGFLASTPSVEAIDDALERAYQTQSDWERIGWRARESILRFLPDDPIEDFIERLFSLVDDGVPMATPIGDASKREQARVH
jgi:glycosyltransferase involved in cell wall biosynthesis